MVKFPPITNKFTLSLKNASITFDWDALRLHKSARFVKKHICKRRPREEEVACPDNRHNEVKMWTHRALLG